MILIHGYGGSNIIMSHLLKEFNHEFQIYNIGIKHK
jgi:hypothetical protein